MKYMLETLDGLSDDVKALYEERDGKFYLKIEGMPVVEDTTALKKALESERSAAAEATKKVKAWEALGKTEEEIADLVKSEAEAAEEQEKARGNFEAIRAQDKEKFDKLIAQADEKVKIAETSERNAIIENHLMVALVKEKVAETSVKMLVRELSDQVKIETKDGKRIISIVQPDGVTPLAGTNDDGTASFADLAGEAVKTYPNMFEVSGRGGGGKQPGSEGGGGTDTKGKKFDDLSSGELTTLLTENPTEYNRLKAERDGT